MPNSWLSTLAASARAVYPYVRRGVRESLSIARIGKAARDGGLRISSASLSEMVRRERDIVRHVQNLGMLGPDRLPNPLRLPEALTRITSKYSVEVKITSVLSSTGARTNIFANIASDSLLSRRQIESAVNNIMSGSQGRYGFEMASFEITGYMRSGPEGFGF